jgi:K+-sensing histidine kinase KdpD
MLTAWHGGFASAILATVLSGLAINYYFIPPVYQGNGKGGPSLARGTLQP